MGRVKNTTDRVEGNMKPSSSSRAAQLLSSSQFGNSSPGLGFGSFSSSANSSNLDLGLEDYSKVSSNVEVILKKLTKRNSTTKLKALDELFVEVRSCTTEELTDLFPVWVLHSQNFFTKVFKSSFYTKLSADLERRVRVVSNQILAFVVEKVGKKIASNLKLVIAPWLASFYDPSREVVEIAKKAFENLFPKDKVQNVLKFGQTTILSYLQDNLLHHSKDTYSDSRFYTSGEMEQRYARIVHCCLGLFGHLIDHLPVDVLSSNQAEYDEILDSPKFLQFFTNLDPTIRQAAYRLVTLLALKAPNLIEARAQGFGSQFLYKAFSEKDASCHRVLFPAIVVSTKAIPDIWNHGKKPTINKLVSFIKENCFNSAALFYPSLPLIVRYLPSLALSSKVIKSLDSAIRINLAEVSSMLVTQTRLETALMVLDRFEELAPKDSNDIIEILKGLVIPREYQVTDSGLTELKDIRIFVSFVIKLVNVVERQQDEGKLELLIDLLNARFESTIDNKVENVQLVANILVELVNYIRKDRDVNKFDSQALFLGIVEKLFANSKTLCQESAASRKVNQTAINRFNFLCYLSQCINLDSGSKLQNQVDSFLDQQLINLMVDFDVSLGLDTLQKYWSGKKEITCPTSQDQTTITKLIELADQPTAAVAYPAKRDLTAIIFSMIKDGDSNTNIQNLLSWTLNTVINLIVAPELNVVPNSRADPVDNLVKLFVNALKLPVDIVGKDFVKNFVKALQNPVHKFKTAVQESGSQSNDYLIKMASAVKVVYRTATLILSSNSSSIYTALAIESELLLTLIDLISLELDKKATPVQTAWSRSAYDSDLFLKTWIQSLAFYDVSVSLELCSKLVTRQLESNRTPSTELITKVNNELGKITTIDNILSAVLPSQALWSKYLRIIFNNLPESIRSMANIHCGIFVSYLDSKHPSLVFQSEQSNTNDIQHLEALDQLEEYTLSLLIESQHGETDTIEDFENLATANIFLVAVLKEILELNRNLGLNDTNDLPLYLLLTIDPSFTDLLSRYKDELELQQLIGTLSKVDNEFKELSYVTIELIWSTWLMSHPPTNSNVQWVFDFARANPTCGYLLLEVLADKYPGEVNSVINFRDQLVESIWFADFDDLIDSDLSQSLLNQSPNLFTDLYLFVGLLHLHLPNSQVQRLASWSIEALERYIDSDVTTLKLWELVLPVVHLTLPHLEDPLKLDLVYITALTILAEDSLAYVNYRLKTHALCLVLVLHQSIDHPGFDSAWKKYKSKLTKTVVNLLLAEAEVEKGLEIKLSKQKYLDNLAEAVVCLIDISDVNTYVHSSKPLYHLMASPHLALGQASAHVLRHKLIDKARLVDPTTKKAANLPVQLFEILNRTVENDLTSRLNYLLAWDLTIEYISAVNHVVKAQLVTRIKATNLTQTLFENLLMMMQIHDARVLDLSRWETTQIYYPHVESNELGAALLASHVYRKLLETTPALARNWWVQLSNRKVISDCESFTARYFTPSILESILKTFNPESGGQLDDTQFTVRCNRSELSVKFLNDGDFIELLLLLPTAYPLNTIEVVGRKHLGIHDKKWRQWLLNCNATLQAPDGNIHEALSLWKRNLKLHFEGVADCAICYAVVGTHNKELPNKTCNTCKNRFHASCLFQWFQTSAQSTCPLCRNLF